MALFIYNHPNHTNPKKSNRVFFVFFYYKESKKACDNIQLNSAICFTQNEPKNYIILLLYFSLFIPLSIIFTPNTQTQPIPRIEYSKCQNMIRLLIFWWNRNRKWYRSHDIFFLPFLSIFFYQINHSKPAKKTIWVW